MAPEPEAGTVSAAQAMMLLLLEPADLKQLERAGAFRPIAPGRYGLVDLVQGFARHVRKADVALVSAQKLAEHLGCVRSYVRKLVEAGVVEQRADGRYDRDQCRERYIAHLRAERRQSPKSAADTEFTAAKAELIRIRIGEQKRELVRQSDVDELIDSMMGVVLTALSSLPVRCAPRGDLVTRRHIERCVFEVRTEIAKVCQERADKNGEPPLDETMTA